MTASTLKTTREHPLDSDLAHSLAQKLLDGQLVLFAGAGLSHLALAKDGSDRRIPLWAGLAQTVAERFGFSPDDFSGSPLDLFDAVIHAHSRGELEQAVTAALADREFELSPAHHALAELPWRTVVTTNYDALLCRSLKETYPIMDEDGYDRLRECKIIQVHGSLPQPHTLTRDDYRLWADRNPRAAHALRDFVLNSTLLFVGYSLSDPHLDETLALVREWTQGREKRQFGLFWQIPTAKQALLDRRDKITAASIDSPEEWHNAFRQIKAELDRLKVDGHSTPSIPTANGLEPEVEHYRTVVEIQHKDIQLAGFKTRLRVPIALEELYVPLQATIDLRGTGDAWFADAADAEDKLGAQGAADIALINAFREALARKRRNLVILGDPGSGKTTHLKRLVLACLRQGPDWLGLPGDTLPVFLPLRELADLQQGIEAFIEKSLDSPHLHMPQGFGKRLLDRGRLLLLFDGLDEVSDSTQRAKVARWIEGAVQARTDCFAVVTCRFAGYDKDSHLHAGFLQLHLRPMSQEQSENFIRNWYQAVETGLTPGHSGELKAVEKATELVERLREPDFRSARMAEMTRNPLLLANLCLVHRDRGGLLPKGRHELYDECIAVLLELWRQNKPIGQGKSLSVSIPAAIGRRTLQPAALWLHGVESRTRASAEELSPILVPALQAAQWRNGDAAQFLQTIRDESGLLTGWSHGAYGFMHLGFQEYLAACELHRLALEEALEDGRRDTLAELAKHYGESWWNEVILLLLAQGNPSLFAPFMNEALKQQRFAEDSALLDLILEETAEFSAAPFVELLRQKPTTLPLLWANQAAALRVLQRLAPDELTPLLATLGQHPHAKICAWVRSRTATPSTELSGFLTIRDETRTSDSEVLQTASNTIITENGGVELLLIPGGRFMMGSPEGEGYENEYPAHEVDIRTFYLGRYPVTNEEYAQFLQANPKEPEPAYWADRRFNQARQPVVGVDWGQACRFAQWAGGRLPSESEWEYAMRAGTTSRFFWGDSDHDIDDYAWHRGNSQGTSHPVGEKRPNQFGLHDMAGNVWEWVQDGWHNNYKRAPSDGSAWEDGTDDRRAVRGGSWDLNPQVLRSGDRDWYLEAGFNLGFRLARAL